MNEEQIKHMVDRFLQWKLPSDFDPDCGISYEPDYDVPTGTNLFTATQARKMVTFMLKGLPMVADNSKLLLEIIEGINSKLDFSGHESGEASVRLSAGEVDMIRNAATGKGE